MSTAAADRGTAGPVLLNVGCGPPGSYLLPACFQGWQELRVDIDPRVTPHIVADIRGLAAIRSGSVDAVWCTHSIEHLYLHEVPAALAGFYRVLRDDGFACVIVPDLQVLAPFLAGDRLHEAVYQSPAGPISAHDILFGHGPALAAGHAAMGHRCGFTPAALAAQFRAAPFGEVALRRRSAQYELAAVARKTAAADPAQRGALLDALLS